jgi:hypothetical protein
MRMQQQRVRELGDGATISAPVFISNFRCLSENVGEYLIGVLV